MTSRDDTEMTVLNSNSFESDAGLTTGNSCWSLTEFLGLNEPRTNTFDNLIYDNLYTISFHSHADGPLTSTKVSNLNRAPSTIRSWLMTEDETGDDGSCGLRILYQRYHGNSLVSVPRFSADEVDAISEATGVPKYIIASKVRFASWALNVDILPDNDLICVHGYFDYIMPGKHHLVLAFDPKKKSTIAIITEIISWEDTPTTARLDQHFTFLHELEMLAAYDFSLISHPMLIPTLLAGQRMQVLDQRFLCTYDEVLDIQEYVDFLTPHHKHYSRYKPRSLAKPIDPRTTTRAELLQYAHSQIMGSKMSLTNLSNDGILDSLRKCAAIVNTKSKLDSWEAKGCESHLSMNIVLSHLIDNAHCFERMRDALHSRIDLFQRGLYHELQSIENRNSREIAKSSKRDSSTMKLFAVLGITVLPTTSVAAIFSMQPFFTSPGSLQVSEDFWVYWVIVIGLMMAILGLWFIYEHWWSERGPQHHVEQGRRAIGFRDD